MKYSTGRGTRMRHSTAMEWDDLKKAKKKYTPVKHSTGEDPAIKHATGIEFDYKHLSEKSEEKKGLHSKVSSKPILEGDEYLEEYQASIRKKSGEERQEKGLIESKKNRSPKKKIVIDY